MPQNEYIQIDDLKIMQKLLCDFMQEIHLICEKNGLIYNLYGGSLLGAIRHQDMIPWDDDIDICMPRKDYEKLLEIIKTDYSDDFILYSYPCKNYIYPFAKICKKGTILTENTLKKKFGTIALYIDVFPIDGVPTSDKKQLRKRYLNAETNKKRAFICARKNTASPTWWKKPYIVVKLLESALFSIIGYKHFVKKQIEETTRFSFEDNDNVAFVSSWGWGEKGIMDKSQVLTRKLYRFGKYEFWGNQDYDTLLSNWYGDYMTPPPENKRIPCHGYTLYVKKDLIDNLTPQ